MGLATDVCTEDTREWTCNKFPKWLQKTYKLSGTDFCKAQWDDLFFSSQPNCDHDILPTVAFYDRSDDQYFADPLCTINMNEAEDGAFGALCPEVDLILNEANEEVWIVYLVHGFAGYSTTPLWYPHHGVGLSNRYKQNGRRIIVGEVYWKEGAEAIFDKFLPPSLVHKIISNTMGRSLPEERAFLEPVAELLTCGPKGLGVGDVAGYSSSASNTMVIGNALGKLTESIYTASTKQNLKSFCVGHSLGGHVCGFTGKTRQLDGIIALDPAGPIFVSNRKEERLNKGDAKFIQALHIDAGEFGIDQNVADQDIYVNTGKNQPYCPGIFAEAGCSHVAFTLWFLPKIWANSVEGNTCRANMRCSDEETAMRNHPACVQDEGEGLEIGLLSDTSNPADSGVFWLDTFEDETSACAFTTWDIAEDAMDAMESGWNDLWSIDVGKWIGK